MFDEDLQYGECGEKFVMEALSNYFHESIKKNPVHSSKECDLIGNTITFEVKRDRMAPTTGNVALEIAYKGEPSGILGTKADYWVTVINKEIWIGSVPILKEWIFEEDAPAVYGGDNMNSRIVLMNKETFKNMFCKIN